MPFKTPRIGIPYFGRGDLYSASADAARMSLIDMEMKAIWDIVGDGVINGFDVSKISNSEVGVSSGLLMLDGKISRLAHDVSVLASSDASIYVRKRREFGGFGLFSAPASFNSFINPSMGELGASVSINDAGNVEVIWSKPVWCNFVRVYRNVFGDVKELVGISYGNSFIDLSAPYGTDIDYYLSAIQFDDIINGILNIGSVTTPPSSSPPPPLTGLTCLPGHKSIYVFWDVPTSSSTSFVELTLSSLDGEISSVEVPASDGFHAFYGIEVGLPYYVDIYALSSAGVRSARKNVFSTPVFSQGPLAPLSLRASLHKDVNANISVINVDWINPITSASSADPDAPGQSDDASGSFTFYNMIQVIEMAGDGSSPNFTGEEFVAQSPTMAMIDVLNYRSASGELLSRKLNNNTRYVISVRRLVNGRYSPAMRVAIKTGNLGELAAPLSGGASISDDGSIKASWVQSQNSAAVAYRLSLASAVILSSTRVYNISPQEILGFVRSSVNVFDFIHFDISSTKLTIRIVPTEQFSSINSISVLKQRMDFSLSAEDTIQDIENIFKRSIPIFAIAGTIFTLNQLYRTISSDPNKSVRDLVSAFDLDPSFEPNIDQSSPPIVPPLDPRDPMFDPNSANMSLVAYYIYYYGGVKIYAVDDFSTATFNDIVSLGNYTDNPVGLGGDYVLDLIGTAFTSSMGFAISGRRYRFSISSVDMAGNESSPLQFYVDAPLSYEIPNADDPSVVHTETHGSSVQLIWSPSRSAIRYYRIFRKMGSNLFVEVAQVKGNSNYYLDIGLDVDINITYVVKSVGIWGNYSQDPDQYNYTQMTYATARVIGADFNTQKISLTASKDGYNALLSWSASDESVDGYEIWCKIPNGVYELIDSVSGELFEYTHNGGLLTEGSYSYSVRPVRGELEVNIAKDANIPSDAYVIASIAFDDAGDLEISRSVRNIGNGIDIVAEATAPRILNHRHLYLPDGQDRRIDLQDYFELSDFISLGDGVRFTHIAEHAPIPPESVMSVFINGFPYSGSFNYSVVTRTITFASAILQPLGPFVEINSIVLKVSDVSELENELPVDNMLSTFGEQMESGVLVEDYIPYREHSGRIRERCTPMLASCSSLDGFRFVISSSETGKARYARSGPSGAADSYIEIGPTEEPPSGFELLQQVGFPLGDSRHVVVYDGCELFPDDSLLLATSIGTVVLKNINSTINWETYIPCNPPNDTGMPHRISASSDGSSIAVVHPRGIDVLKYVQDNNNLGSTRYLIVIANAMGLDLNIKFIRDICSIDGNFFATSDIGPIGLVVNGDATPEIRLLSLPDAEDSETYACASDSSNLYVSTKTGIFISDNAGDTWALFSTTPSIVRSIKIYNGFLYALTADSLVRISMVNRSSSTIHYSEGAKYRKMDIFNDRIMLIGDMGCMVSDIRYSIIFSPSVAFQRIKSLPKFSSVIRAARSVFKYRDGICVGGDAFISRGVVYSRIKTMIDFSMAMPVGDRSKIPTVYGNGVPVENGCYLQYSANRYSPECVFFDDQRDSGETVSVARQYTDVVAKNGGWAWRDFSAPVVVKINGNPINDGSRSDKPVDQLLDLVANDMVFSDLFSRRTEAAEDFSKLGAIISEMTNNDTALSENPQSVGVHRFTRANVRKYIDTLNKLNSKIYSDEAMSLLGTRQSMTLKSPEFKTNLIANFVEGGVSSINLDRRAMVYSPYGPEFCIGSLGTYDPEDTLMLTGSVPTSTPRDGTDNPIYLDPNSEFARPAIPGPGSSAILSGYFSRPCTGTDECPEVPQSYMQPRPPGSLTGSGSSNGSSSSSPVVPPSGGGPGA
jgi:hypothetical protein